MQPFQVKDWTMAKRARRAALITMIRANHARAAVPPPRPDTAWNSSQAPARRNAIWSEASGSRLMVGDGKGTGSLSSPLMRSGRSGRSPEPEAIEGAIHREVSSPRGVAWKQASKVNAPRARLGGPPSRDQHFGSRRDRIPRTVTRTIPPYRPSSAQASTAPYAQGARMTIARRIASLERCIGHGSGWVRFGMDKQSHDQAR